MVTHDTGIFTKASTCALPAGAKDILQAFDAALDSLLWKTSSARRC